MHCRGQKRKPLDLAEVTGTALTEEHRIENSYLISQGYEKESGHLSGTLGGKRVVCKKSEPQVCAIYEWGARIHTLPIIGNPRIENIPEKLVCTKQNFTVCAMGQPSHHVQMPHELEIPEASTKNPQLQINLPQEETKYQERGFKVCLEF